MIIGLDFFKLTKNRINKSNFSTNVLIRQNEQLKEKSNIQKKETNLTNSQLKPSNQTITSSKITSNFKKRVGPNFIKIWVSYVFIVVGGITTFYYAKKEVEQNRQNAMKIKKEIFTNDEKEKYPNRLEKVLAERELRNLNQK